MLPPQAEHNQTMHHNFVRHVKVPPHIGSDACPEQYFQEWSVYRVAFRILYMRHIALPTLIGVYAKEQTADENQLLRGFSLDSEIHLLYRLPGHAHIL